MRDRHPAESQQQSCPGPTKENICAVVIAYFPDVHFRERLDKIRDQVGGTIIVDNTGSAGSGVSLGSLNRSDVEVIANDENLGIGAALNQGVSGAIQLGYEWVITFDQDSWVEPNLVEILATIYKQQPRPELVGIIGCNFEDENTRALSAKGLAEGAIFRETEAVITSGSLLSAATFSKAGPFRSDFFIDFVDHEYCLRLRKLGFKIIMSAVPLMTHALGDPTTLSLNSRVADFSLVLTNRSPLRRYYMTRNGLFVAKEYLAVAPRWVLRSLVSFLGVALLKIPFEKTSRGKKFCATVYGALDALRGRTGKARAAWLKG